MDRFHNGQRVRLRDDIGDDVPTPLHGQVGTVARLRRADDGAWVALDAYPEDYPRSFPADDPHGRGNHILLFPADCEPATEGA